MIELVINSVTIILLSITLVYCWYLSRRLKELRDSQTPLAENIRMLDAAMAKTEATTKVLKETAHDSVNHIQEHIRQAHQICDELELLSSKAVRIARAGAQSPPVSAPKAKKREAKPEFVIEEESTEAYEDQFIQNEEQTATKALKANEIREMIRKAARQAELELERRQEARKKVAEEKKHAPRTQAERDLIALMREREIG